MSNIFLSDEHLAQMHSTLAQMNTDVHKHLYNLTTEADDRQALRHLRDALSTATTFIEAAQLRRSQDKSQ